MASNAALVAVGALTLRALLAGDDHPDNLKLAFVKIITYIKKAMVSTFLARHAAALRVPILTRSTAIHQTYMTILVASSTNRQPPIPSISSGC